MMGPDGQLKAMNSVGAGASQEAVLAAFVASLDRAQACPDRTQSQIHSLACILLHPLSHTTLHSAGCFCRGLL